MMQQQHGGPNSMHIQRHPGMGGPRSIGGAVMADGHYQQAEGIELTPTVKEKKKKSSKKKKVDKTQVRNPIYPTSIEIDSICTLLPT